MTQMSTMEQSQQTYIQAKVFDFALVELVRNHRDSFQPLWTVDSWVKFLIWMTLNCGLSGERESLELFADALGPSLTRRIRSVFFERTVDSLSIKLIADPADSQILVMPTNNGVLFTIEIVEQALDHVGLLERVNSNKFLWKELDAVFAIPWQSKSVDA